MPSWTLISATTPPVGSRETVIRPELRRVHRERAVSRSDPASSPRRQGGRLARDLVPASDRGGRSEAELFEADADRPFNLAFFQAFRPAGRTPLVCRSITRCAPRLCGSRLMWA